MRHIPNLKALYTPSGQPYTIGEPDKDEDGETQPLLDSDGAILHDGQGGILLKAHQIAPALDRWIDMTLAGVPAARATMKDVAHAGSVLRSISQHNGTLSFEEADYDWLMEVMFSDARGKSFNDKAEGALAIQRWGMVLAGALKDALDGKVEGDVDDNAPVPMNREARRRAK